MQRNIIIADASCLILFEKLKLLDILHQLFGWIIITQDVADEFGNDVPEWIIITEPKDRASVLVLESSVDRGEASSIALALEFSQCLLIIDDRKGRQVARRLGINITGSLGVLVDAKMEGIISQIKPVLGKIKQTNFRFSKQIETEILRHAGEL